MCKLKSIKLDFWVQRKLSWRTSSAYGRLHKTPFFSTPMQALCQLQLRTDFTRPEGVRLPQSPVQCSTKSSDWHYPFNSLNYHFAIHSPANFAGLLSVCYYHIDTDEIPGFFHWRKFGIQWRYNFCLSHVKISRLSWLLQSQPIGNCHHTIARVHGFFIHKSVILKNKMDFQVNYQIST